jgi:perosamine synthetase
VNHLPYGRQTIEDADLAAVAEVLRGDWLTTGPKVAEFERAVAHFTGAAEAVAVNSGTAALHCAMAALNAGPGDEVIVPAITFAATANCVAYRGGTPVFADVNPDTLLIDPASVEAWLTPRTKAVIAVDYAGQPCDYDVLREITGRRGLALVADACHAMGATYHGRPVGSLADLSTFSFHPVKPITTGEGGMVTTDGPEWARRMRAFRNHGITTDHRQREAAGSWYYEMVELGFNYRLTDLQCALGLAQLPRLPAWLRRREAIARRYHRAFAGNPAVRPLAELPGRTHGRHLYVVRVAGDRKRVFSELRARGVGVQVHYIPVHLHPFYRERFGTGPGLCPRAEAAYEQILSLPIYPAMSDTDVDRVVDTLIDTAEGQTGGA